MSEVTVLSKEVESITDNMYWIDPTKLMFADGGFSLENDKLEYRNIRYASAGHKLIGKGMEPQTMSRLTERIRTEGLHQCPICRWFEGGVQVVDGERRTRAICKLIADKATCWDKKTKSWVPAHELYAKIMVFIDEMDDETALKINFSASESGENFGDGAVVAYVKYLRKCNLGDKEILSLTGHKEEWLRQTDKLCNLDEKSFVALSDGKITRGLACDLLEIDDIDSRLAELDRRIALAEQRYAQKTAELKAKVEMAKENLGDVVEEISGDHQAIKMSEDDKKAENIQEVEKSRKKKSKAEKIVKSAEEKLAKHKDSSPKAGAKTDTEAKPLTWSKIERHWLETILATIKSGCKDETDQDLEIDLEDVYLSKFLCEQIRKGQKDILRILKAHKKHKVERAAK